MRCLLTHDCISLWVWAVPATWGGGQGEDRLDSHLHGCCGGTHPNLPVPIGHG